MPDFTDEEATLLFELARVWADRYQLTVIDGVWRAARLGNATVVITADSGQQLGVLIAQDYQQWVAEARRLNGMNTENSGSSI